MAKRKQKKVHLRTLQRGDLINLGGQNAIVTANIVRDGQWSTIHIADTKGTYAGKKQYRANATDDGYHQTVPRFYRPMFPGSREDITPQPLPDKPMAIQGHAANLGDIDAQIQDILTQTNKEITQ